MKRFFIIIILLLAAIGGGAYFYYNNKHVKIPEYQRTELEEIPKFASVEERNQYVDNFANAGEILDDENEDHTYNAGGFTTANVMNLAEISEYIGIDGMVFVQEELTLAMEMLPKLRKDTQGLEDNKIESYLSTYRNEIVRQYGISAIGKFKDFIMSLSFIDKGEKINEGVIIKSSIKKVGNNVSFDFTVKTNKENTYTYIITVVIFTLNETSDYLIYWSVRK